MSALIQPGSRVRLNVPENLQLHGAPGIVRQMASWGAYVDTTAAATGQFRALWSEMIAAGEAAEDARGELATLNTGAGSSLLDTPFPAVVPRPGKGQNGTGRLPPQPTAPSPKIEYTGEACSTCGVLNMRRAGTCSVCENCGTSGGCG